MPDHDAETDAILAMPSEAGVVELHASGRQIQAQLGAVAAARVLSAPRSLFRPDCVNVATAHDATVVVDPDAIAVTDRGRQDEP